MNPKKFARYVKLTLTERELSPILELESEVTAMLFIDKIDAEGCEIVFVWHPHMVGDEWCFDAKTLAGTTLLKTSIVSKSRARVEALRNELIDDLCARDIEVVEVGRMMLRTVDGEVSIALQ